MFQIISRQRRKNRCDRFGDVFHEKFMKLLGRCTQEYVDMKYDPDYLKVE